MPDDSDRQTSNSGPDPLEKSLSGPLLVCSVLLFLSLGWALYDELIGQRPWKAQQARFVRLYESYLKKLGPRQAAAEKTVFASPEFRKIDQELKAAEQAANPRIRQIEAELSAVRQQLAAIKDPFQDTRARIAAIMYEVDHAGPGGKKGLRNDIQEIKKGPFRVAFAGKTENLSFDDLERRFTELKSREAKLVAEQAEVTKPVRELRKLRGEFLGERLEGLSQEQIAGLRRKMETFRVEIKQIHVEEASLVDRCESCHLGIREPVTLTAADMGGHREFVSHPNKTLLAIHDPERFGCTPCHNGNGLATASAEQAHGRYHHWLWPLFSKENSEAGCLQCHFNDRVLEQAPVLNRGRDLFQVKGCVGCHRYEGFDRDADALADVRKQIQSLQNRQKEDRLEGDRETKAGDQAESNQAAQRHYAQAESLRVSASNIDARIAELDQKAKFLMQDQKKVGPNLKDARLKLRKEWIPVWLKDPPAFRPGTKMPRFRLAEDEIRALSAFVWQSALDGPRPEAQPKGDAANGKELFETRGCLGCHSIGEGGSRMGDEFAANLSRLGEKAGYDYIVRWVHNPRERTRPYCPREKRDLGPEDYSRHGLPYVFDIAHSTCPNDGFELQVQNMTVMPNLRLSPAEARDIATYLTSLKRTDAAYPSDVSYMDDTGLAARGRATGGPLRVRQLP